MKHLSHSQKRIVASTLMSALALFAWQCIEKPLEPLAPSADVQLSIPIADVTKTLDEAFGKDTSTVKRDVFSGGFYFTDTQAGQPTKLDSIRTTPQASTNQVTVGVVQVDPIPPTNASVTVPGAPTGFVGVFPGITTSVAGVSVSDTSLFAYAKVVSGSLTMSITNNLPTPLIFNRPVVLRNNKTSVPVDTSILATFAFDTVAATKTVSKTTNIGGKFLRGQFKTDSLYVTIKSGTNLTFPSSSGFQFSFGSTTLTVDSARAVVPSQTVASIKDSIIVVDDSVSLSTASFRRGSFIARIVNNLGINVGVQLKFDNFKNPVTGSVLQINQALSPRQTADFPVNLDTVNVINPTPAATGTFLKFSVSIQTITSNGAKSTIASSDFVRAQFLPQGTFVLKGVTGKIKPTYQAINSGASGVNLGDAADRFRGNFVFDSVRLAVNLGMTGGFPTSYNLKLIARNRSIGKTDSLTLPPPVGSAIRIINPSGNVMTRIELGNTQGLNTFLAGFFPNLPDTFIVRGNVVINPNFAQETIADTTKIYQAVNMYFPLKLGLANGRMESKISMTDSKFPTEFANDVKKTTLNLAITNGLPVQLAFSARMLGWKKVGSLNVRDTLLYIPSDKSFRTIGASAVDVNGNATTAQLSQFALSLADSEVVAFNKADTMYIRLDMVTPANTGSPGSQAVRFRQTDQIRLRMSGNIVYTVNKQN